MGYFEEREQMFDGYLMERFPILDRLEKGLVTEDGEPYAELHLKDGQVLSVSEDDCQGYSPTELDDLYDCASGHGGPTSLSKVLDTFASPL